MDKSRWKLIRTERIKASLEEATVNKLKQDTVRGFPGTRARQNSPDPVRVVEKQYTPYVPSGNLLVRSLVDNQGNKYNPEIFFDDVQYEDEDSPTNVTFVASDGKNYSIQPIALSQNNARIKCTCLDFHYRFAHTNAKDQSLYGDPPPPYQRKTTTYPSVNPMKVVGLCKHLLKLVDELQKDHVVR